MKKQNLRHFLIILSCVAPLSVTGQTQQNIIIGLNNGNRFYTSVDEIKEFDIADDEVLNMINLNDISQKQIIEEGVQETLQLKSGILDASSLNFTWGYYLKQNNGTTISYKNYGYSDYIPVDRGDRLIFNNICYFSNFGCWYDQDKRYIGGIKGDDTAHERLEIIVPANACYLRFNTRKDYVDLTFEISGKSDVYTSESIRVPADNINGFEAKVQSVFPSHDEHLLHKPFPLESGKTILGFGDSITYGVASSSNYAEANEGGYKYLKVLADAFGMTLVNKGHSSATATDMTGAGRPWLYDDINGTNGVSPDLITVAIGINDYMANNEKLGSLSDDYNSDDESVSGSFYASMKKCVDLIQSKWPGIPVILITPVNYIGTLSVSNSLNKFRDAIFEVGMIKGCSVVCGDRIPLPKDKSNSMLANMMMADNLHPTRLGHFVYGKALTGILK